MSSLFTKIDSLKIDGFLGEQHTIPFYLQFVPGNVVDVVTSDASLHYLGPNTINSIKALPHITNDTYVKRENLSEKYRYYPLFRGMVDVPVKGDPVLLCTIGKVNYYLGPLNTNTNLPTFNTDPNKEDEVYMYGQNQGDFDEPYKISELRGENPNFSEDKTNHKRMSKIYNELLDHPWNSNTKLPEIGENGTIKNRNIRDIHGDMLFEGRHGNSIRIGSRHKNPYVMISNGRNETNNFEGIGDGSLISITERGSLAQHFGGYLKSSNDENAIKGKISIPEFILASDSVYNFKRSMGELIKISNGGELPIKSLIYEYTDNQILIHSDRITINSKLDDLFISSYKDMHIGSGRNLTISTNEDLIIESRNIYLGKTVNYNEEGEGESRVMEPMVLGQTLVDILNDLIDCLSTAHVYMPSGNTAPITDIFKSSLASKDNQKLGRKSLGNIKKQLNTIKSNYHWIEPNEGTSK